MARKATKKKPAAKKNGTAAPKVSKKRGPVEFYARIRPFNRKAGPPQMAVNLAVFGKKFKAAVGWYGPLTEVQDGDLLEEMRTHKLHFSYATSFEVCTTEEMQKVTMEERQAILVGGGAALPTAPVVATPPGGGTMTTVEIGAK